MLIYEYKLDGKKPQYQAIDEAIRVVQFIRNKCLRKWMDGRGVSRNDLQCHCAELAQEYSFAARLNSQARQISADRAWAAISRFYKNCREKKPGKKGYPRFQHDNRSVEYKHTGWKLEPDGRHLTFTDGCGIGTLRLVGNKKQERDTFPTSHIKRVRIVHRADGYYVQFGVQAQRRVEHTLTGKSVGVDLGLNVYYADSDGNTLENPRHYRKAEKRLKRLHRRLSKKQKGSANRKKARKQVAKAHLKVSRQREDFARKQASTLVSSHDFLAYEDLKIRNMVRNRHLAKSIHDASWGKFLQWVNYYGTMHGIPIIAVPPQFTSQDCSGCGARVKKSLSVRTHICLACGLVLDRDENAAKNIWYAGLLILLLMAFAGTVGHTGTSSDEENASGQPAATRPSRRRTTSKRAG
ncbi:MAG: transposase [Ktedonobacteraceae bacterium]|nr:transposase [Ktedonobacteraceae bacterium]